VAGEGVAHVVEAQGRSSIVVDPVSSVAFFKTRRATFRSPWGVPREVEKTQSVGAANSVA